MYLIHLEDLETKRFTEDGIKRLAIVISATLNYWKQNSLGSARSLAKQARVSNATISKYTRAESVNPSPDIIKQLAPFIYRVTKIDLNQGICEIDPETTYGKDWRDLECIATDDWTDAIGHKCRRTIRVAETNSNYGWNDLSATEHHG